MSKRMFKCCLLLFIVFSLINTDAAQINYQLLEPTTRNFSSRVLSGSVIEEDEIKSSFDFIPYDARPIEWDKSKFSILVKNAEAICSEAFEKLGHNRFHTFVSDCKSLFDSGVLKNNDPFALYTLLAHVTHKVDFLLKEVESTVEQESRIPDEQFSFFFDCRQSRPRSDSEQSTASTPHISSCESTTTSSDHTSITDEQNDPVFSQINLDGRSLEESSFCYYPKKISTASLPICISCNLQTIRIDQIEKLKNALREIGGTGHLREIIFQKGSSRKFNLLFGTFKDIAEKRSPENPITIIYSTTSDSQKAYKKLSTLQGVLDRLPSMDTDKDMASLRTESIHACQRLRVDFSDNTLDRIRAIIGE